MDIDRHAKAEGCEACFNSGHYDRDKCTDCENNVGGIEMRRRMADVIFTPVFADTRYLNHRCSECGYELYVGQSIWGGVCFDDTGKIKFCPQCGNRVVRFSDKPIYEAPIDFEPLRVFYNLHEEYERKCRWMYNCVISDERKKKIEELLPFVKDACGWVRIAYEAVSVGSRYKTDRRKCNELMKEFGGKESG